MCAHRSLLLALILSTLSYASHSKGDVNMTSLKGLIKAIFLFKGAKKRVFGCKSYKRRLTAFGYELSDFLRRKYLKTTLYKRLSGGGTLVLPQSGDYTVLGRYLVLHR